MSHHPLDFHHGPCPICLGDDVPCDAKLQCKTALHHFHSTCILEWLSAHRTCPLCRDEFAPRSISRLVNYPTRCCYSIQGTSLFMTRIREDITLISQIIETTHSRQERKVLQRRRINMYMTADELALDL